MKSVSTNGGEVASLASYGFEVPVLVVIASDGGTGQSADPLVSATLHGNGPGEAPTVEVDTNADKPLSVAVGDAVVVDRDKAGLLQMKVPVGTIASGPLNQSAETRAFEMVPSVGDRISSGTDLAVLVRHQVPLVSSD
jgi:hypothetical protein